MRDRIRSILTPSVGEVALEVRTGRIFVMDVPPKLQRVDEIV